MDGDFGVSVGGGATSSGAGAVPSASFPRPRWAWRAAVDLAEDDEGAALAGEAGPPRPVTSWWKPRPAERPPEVCVSADPTPIATGTSVPAEVCAWDRLANEDVVELATGAEEERHVDSIQERAQAQARARAEAEAEAEVEVSCHAMEAAALASPESEDLGQTPVGGHSEESDPEAEPEAEVEACGLPQKAESPRGFRGEPLRAPGCGQRGLAPWDDPWEAAPSFGAPPVGMERMMGHRFGLEYEEVPLRAGPRSLLQRSRSTSTMQHAQKGLWTVSPAPRFPAPQGPPPNQSALYGPGLPPHPGGFNGGGPPLPPSAGFSRPSPSSVAALRAVSGAAAHLGGRRSSRSLMDRCAEVDTRCSMPRLLPALGRY